jgi:hypothetical protein
LQPHQLLESLRIKIRKIVVITTQKQHVENKKNPNATRIFRIGKFATGEAPIGHSYEEIMDRFIDDERVNLLRILQVQSELGLESMVTGPELPRQSSMGISEITMKSRRAK